MDLRSLMIGATFLLGVVVVLVGLLALWKNKAKAGQGSLKIAGIEVSGNSGSVLILLVGAAFVLSGFGWAASQGEAETRTQELGAANEAVVKYEEEKAAVREQMRLHLTPDQIKVIESKVPSITTGKKWTPSPSATEGIRRLSPGTVTKKP